MSKREDILQGLRSLIASDSWFPTVWLDEPEPSNWRTNIPGEVAAMGDYCAVQDGPLHITRDGGAANDFELQVDTTIAYAVMLADGAPRRLRRDTASDRIAALIAANRGLGLGDPQIYAEISDATRDDNVPVNHAAPAAILLLTVSIQFVAPSAAG